MITKVFDGASNGFGERKSAENQAEGDALKKAHEFIESRKDEDLIIFDKKELKSHTSGGSYNTYNGQCSYSFTFCTRKEKEELDNKKSLPDKQDRFLSLVEEHGYDKMSELLDKFYKLNARPMH